MYHNVQSLASLMVPLVALLIGRLAVSVVCKVAPAVGFVDKPDRRRKLQDAPIALGGGIAVWIATWSGWGAGLLGPSSEVSGAGDAIRSYAGLAIVSLLILGLGVIDDRYGIRGRHKLTGQILAAIILVGLGLRIDVLSCFGIEVHMGVFAYPMTVLWIILVVNAFNLIDGMDGFCGSLGLVASLAIAFIAYRSGFLVDVTVALALAGALAAFLWDNIPPAKVYLGDAGSMTIGMIIAFLSIRVCSAGPGTPVFLPPMLALLTLPLLDVATAFGRRWLTGRSMFTPDRGHLHHILRSRLGSTNAALFVGVGLAGFGAGGAVLATANGMGDGMACLAVLITVGMLVYTNTFGGSELRLLWFRLRSTLSPILSSRAIRNTGVRQECHLHGSRDWARVWGNLVREVETAGGVWRIELAIDMAAQGEVYHGLWCLPTASEDALSWSVVHALDAGGVPAGILRMAGYVAASKSQYLHKVEQLVRGLEAELVSAVPPRQLTAAELFASANLPALPLASELIDLFGDLGAAGCPDAVISSGQLSTATIF